MHDYLRSVLEQSQTHQIVATTALLAGVLVLRWLLLRTIKHASIKSADLRRRWIVQIRGAGFLILVLGLVVVWAPQLHTAALSVVAITAAIVLATRELLLCLSGGFFKVTSRSFMLGDRIAVKGMRGDVIDQTLLSTTIMEIGPGLDLHQGTSRAVTLPNSLFLTEPVFNESFTKEYVLHTFIVPLKISDDWQQAQDILLQQANETCRPFLDDAQRHFERLTKRESFDTPSVEPRVLLKLPEPDRVDLVVRVPAPADRKGRIEQYILRRYLNMFTGGDKTEPPPPTT